MHDFIRACICVCVHVYLLIMKIFIYMLWAILFTYNEFYVMFWATVD